MVVLMDASVLVLQSVPEKEAQLKSLIVRSEIRSLSAKPFKS